MTRAGVRTWAAALLVGVARVAVAAPAPPAAPAAGDGDRRIQVGDPVEDVELRTLDGRREHFLQKGVAANVFVFFRPEQARSADTLRDLATCERELELERKPVRWVGVVSDSWPVETVKAMLRETGARLTVLVDAGDALYGRLGIRLHPVIGIVDGHGRLAAFEPFRQINYCDRVRVRIRALLGEATEADVAHADAPASSPLPHSERGVASRHLHLARRLHELEQDGPALAEVQKALAAAPSAAAWALRGEILAAQGSCPEALRAFEAALAIDRANAAARDGERKCKR